MKPPAGRSEWLLRESLLRYVPKHLVKRAKKGFGAPIDAWLRGPLNEWAETLPDEKRLTREGIFDPGAIGQKWREHPSGARNPQYELEVVLMLQV